MQCLLEAKGGGGPWSACVNKPTPLEVRAEHKAGTQGLALDSSSSYQHPRGKQEATGTTYKTQAAKQATPFRKQTLLARKRSQLIPIRLHHLTVHTQAR